MSEFSYYFPDLHEFRIYRADGTYWTFKIDDVELGEKCHQFVQDALQEVIEAILNV